jgi:hypothetical protein
MKSVWKNASLWLCLSALLGCMVPVATGSADKTASDPAAKDADYRRLVIGTWEDEYEGKRVMTVREDGTATMVVTLSGLKATLYAKQLRFDMVWAIANGRLKKKTTGGQPSGRVKLILKMMGDHVDEPILELSNDRLLLQDQNGKRKYDWRKVHIGEKVSMAPGVSPGQSPWELGHTNDDLP